MSDINVSPSLVEEQRLAALRGFDVMDTLPEQGYEDVTQLAAFLCGTPMSLISLIDRDRQWFKSKRGVGLSETPMSMSFCKTTLVEKRTLVVADASKDSRFENNPLVTGDPNIRFYAGAPIIEADGHVLGTVCVIDTVPRELTAEQVAALEALARQVMTLLEQRKSIAKLEQSEAGLEQVMRATTDAVMSVNGEWVITYLNPMAERIYGAAAALIGSRLWDVFPNAAYEGSPFVEHCYRAMEEGIAGSFEAEYGEPLNFTLGLEVYPAKDGIVTFSRDVTKVKQAMAAALQNEKLAAVGRLASSIAHEINNPLESVTNLMYLARHTDEKSPREEYLDLAERELRRVSAITNQTLRFYKQATRPMQVSCTELFEETLMLYQGRLVNSNILVEKRKRATQAATCFEGEIRQVLSNLVGNAIDAMPAQGGRLLLRSRHAVDWKTGTKGLALTVADNGSGMPAAVMQRVFEAFYSTKGIAGTGLGLWVSQEIVTRHQGTLRVRSSTDAQRHGTVFVLFLPFEMAPDAPHGDAMFA